MRLVLGVNLVNRHSAADVGDKLLIIAARIFISSLTTWQGQTMGQCILNGMSSYIIVY